MIVLASTSSYRAELLARFGLHFEQASPNCDETPRVGEKPHNLALRLAKTKALSLQRSFPDDVLIGSDQVCELNGQVLGKPGTVDRAIEQLKSMRGQSVIFHTGLSVLLSTSGESRESVDTTVARLRDLDDAEIERYIAAEMPLNCAGSFMVEKLGITLFDKIESTDPTALIGLPLIQLSRDLRYFGIAVP